MEKKFEFSPSNKTKKQFKHQTKMFNFSMKSQITLSFCLFFEKNENKLNDKIAQVKKKLTDCL